MRISPFPPNELLLLRLSNFSLSRFGQPAARGGRGGAAVTDHINGGRLTEEEDEY